MRLVIEGHDDGMSVACEAATGDEALERVDHCDSKVVILDEMMPGMSGVDTATQLRARRPDQIMIICSSSVIDDVLRGAHAAGVAGCVSREQLRSAPVLIRKAVAASAGP